MTLGKFTRYLIDNNCELIPMPDWNRANTLKIINRSNNLTAYLNTNIEGDLFESIIEGICSRLSIPLPPNYQSS
jgi:hypothetical protein